MLHTAIGSPGAAPFAARLGEGHGQVHSRPRPHPRRGRILAAAAGAGALLLSVGVGQRPAAVAASAGAGLATTSGITFSHGVPVDEQRPGFEPDIAVDPHPRGTDDGQRIFTSTPFGFSTTESFISQSRDTGETYKLVPGQVGPGKPTTCVGGGDTELQLDANGAMFFSDLQGLTNLSNSVSTDHGTTFKTNCVAAPNTPVDRMWYAHTGTLAGHNLNLYEEYDAVASSANGNNQLVETVSHDGLTFLPLVNATPSPACLGLGAANCVNNNEGLPGNQIVDPASGNIFIVHTAPGPATSGTPQVLVERGTLQQGGAAVTWQHIGPINAGLCPDPTCVDGAGNPEVIAGENFPVIAEDSSHTFYVAFASAPLDHNAADPNFGAPTAPESIYVVSSSDGTHWGTPRLVSNGGTNTFPWITAGDSGRVDLAWYHTGETSEQGPCASGSGTCTNYGASALNHAEWTVDMAQSINAAGSSPGYTVVNASEHPIKHGQICTNGLGCATGGDRSLGDYLEITTDKYGAAMISYVDDTSNTFMGGQAAGPTEIVRQTSGPSLLAAVGTISGARGPHQAMNHVLDDAGDATYDANNMSLQASPNLDLLGASMSQDTNGLVITMQLKSLATLAPSPTDGGTDLSWLMRWTQVVPGTPGNGHVWYAGMESNAGGAPRFFDGDMKCQIATTHCKYFTYPGDHTIQGTEDAATNTITLHVPLADVGSPASGTPLYSVVAFTTSELAPLSVPSIFNQIDATVPFVRVVS